MINQVINEGQRTANRFDYGTRTADFRPATRRWLVVDDNPDFLLALSATLEHLTTATIECHDSPASALAAFIQAPDAYELVITDFELPVMNGSEFCRRLQSITPGQKVFLTTGSGFFTDRTAHAAGFSALLCKPFSLATLRLALGSLQLASAAA